MSKSWKQTGQDNESGDGIRSQRCVAATNDKTQNDVAAEPSTPVNSSQSYSQAMLEAAHLELERSQGGLP
jgi:hypothetical protein